jgi:hypothetical protein
MSPEVLLCSECHEPVDLEQHEYVVTNRETAPTRDNRLYAHFNCVRGQGKSIQDLSDLEVEAVHRRILEQLDDEAMERLGIRRIHREPR